MVTIGLAGIEPTCAGLWILQLHYRCATSPDLLAQEVTPRDAHNNVLSYTGQLSLMINQRQTPTRPSLQANPSATYRQSFVKDQPSK